MKIFLVGGAVRDSLLGLPIKDRDWVVVGATPQQMLDAGYQQVGRDFPVFLHPYSHEEYSLARTERKSGFGYHGFTCNFTPDITLEQDLQRRDLTINALAQDNKGRIIDVKHGLSDLKHRILRHMSSSFIEDPLRVLRVARFASYYAHLNFRIADETMALMREISSTKELTYLTPERIWKETENALSTNNPQIYFQILHSCGALKKILPEADMLFNTSFSSKWHQKLNISTNMMTLRLITKLSTEIDVRFATLCYELNKLLIQKQLHMNCHNKVLTSVKLIDQICKRLHVPKTPCDLAKLVIRFNDLINDLPNLSPNVIVQLFDNIDAWRKPKRIEQILLISKASAHTNNHLIKTHNYLQEQILKEIWKIIKMVSTKSITEDGFKGAAIGKELTKRRIQAVEYWKNRYFYNHEIN